MEDLSLHILDIAENSIRANAENISISIQENTQKDLLSLNIIDDGFGMDKETLKKALNPFFSTKKERRFGLGLSMLAESARAANGQFSIESKPGKGTHIRATFQASHIDRKPLGDISTTLVTLIIGNSEIDIVYMHAFNTSNYRLDTQDIKKQLNGIPVSSPEGMKYIRKNIKEGLERLRRNK